MWTNGKCIDRFERNRLLHSGSKHVSGILPARETLMNTAVYYCIVMKWVMIVVQDERIPKILNYASTTRNAMIALLPTCRHHHHIQLQQVRHELLLTFLLYPTFSYLSCRCLTFHQVGIWCLYRLKSVANHH